MVVGILIIHLHLPGSNSLKDKRKVVRSLKDRIKHNYNVSVSETDGHKSWRFCEISVAMVGASPMAVKDELLDIIEYSCDMDNAEIEDWWIDYY